jgi:uncharacterized protein YuzE
MTSAATNPAGGAILTDHARTPTAYRTSRLDQPPGEVSSADMNVTYDPHTDTLSIVLTGAAIAESDEDKPGVILDYDADGNLVALEILDASKRMPNPASVRLEVANPAA